MAGRDRLEGGGGCRLPICVYEGNRGCDLDRPAIRKESGGSAARRDSGGSLSLLSFVFRSERSNRQLHSRCWSAAKRRIAASSRCGRSAAMEREVERRIDRACIA